MYQRLFLLNTQEVLTLLVVAYSSMIHERLTSYIYANRIIPAPTVRTTIATGEETPFWVEAIYHFLFLRRCRAWFLMFLVKDI